VARGVVLGIGYATSLPCGTYCDPSEGPAGKLEAPLLLRSAHTPNAYPLPDSTLCGPLLCNKLENQHEKLPRIAGGTVVQERVVRLNRDARRDCNAILHGVAKLARVPCAMEEAGLD
jgi:hypothetical protein